MQLKRRNFIRLTALAAAAGIARPKSSLANPAFPPALAGSLNNVSPISLEERQSRVEKAQRLMTELKYDAMKIDCGTSLEYFLGIGWWPSERPMVAIIPAKGDVRYVCPAFEEARLREVSRIGKTVYAWQEDENPYKLVANAFRDIGHVNTVAVEERLRFFILDGVKKETSGISYVSGVPVTMPCRLIKSAAEIALMQKANDITSAGIKYGIGQMQEGISQGDLADVISEAQQKLGGHSADALVLFGESSAFPHGSVKPRKLRKGDIVLMDCGCSVEGYTSDITRTIVFGDPTKRQTDIWNLEKKAQDAGFAAAKIGAACEEVDAAARKVITDAGFGPGYKLPGLPHRTGHGIGLDGHEWTNFVKGNQTKLAPGMCFSDEPMIAIPGEFGIRLEDDVYISEDGPQFFSKPSIAIDKPFAD